MDHKFKVGDKVYVSDDFISGVVGAIDFNDPRVPYRVTFYDVSGYGWFSESELSATKPDPIITVVADEEVTALDILVSTLDDLTAEQAQRSIRYLCDRYGMYANAPGAMSPLYRNGI